MVIAETKGKKHPIISVIIPGFNCEKTIYACIDSVLSTMSSDVEIIYVDDGSEDESLKIVSSIKSPLLFIYSISHSGVSEARNFGIRRSSGTYVLFLDSDDFVDTKSMADLLNFVAHEVNQIDLFVFPYKTISADGVKTFALSTGIVPLKQSDVSVIKKNILPLMETCIANNIGTKLYLRSIVSNNKIAFASTLSITEDIRFFLDYLKFVHSFIYWPNPLYVYVINNRNSLMEKKNPHFEMLEYSLFFRIYNQFQIGTANENTKRSFKVLYFKSLFNVCYRTDWRRSTISSIITRAKNTFLWNETKKTKIPKGNPKVSFFAWAFNHKMSAAISCYLKIHHIRTQSER
jgi:glycosyltransferase involved in cell wall biosynthesis